MSLTANRDIKFVSLRFLLKTFVINRIKIHLAASSQ